MRPKLAIRGLRSASTARMRRVHGRRPAEIAFSIAILAAVPAAIAAKKANSHRFCGGSQSRDSAPASDSDHSDHMDLPHVMLWAWATRQDLRFLNPRAAGVAFLAGTIEIGPDGSELNDRGTAVMHPRLQPLSIPPGTALMAVIRVETPNDLWHQWNNHHGRSSTNGRDPVYSAAQELKTANLIASMADIPGVRAVQVDYDATRSEQRFYARLLRDVRQRLPQGMPLSVTALASWCVGDRWLDRLPPGTVQEAVPMLFRMGPDANDIAAYLRAGNEFPERLCQASLGVSTDEAFSRSVLDGSTAINERSRPAHVYVFSGQPWTPGIANRVVAKVKSWDGDERASR